MGLHIFYFLVIGAFLPACLADLSRAHNADALSALKSMVDKRAISPEQQKFCSSYYFPLMEAVSSSYDAALQACHDAAGKAHQDVSNSASVTYEEIQSMSNSLCNKNCDLAVQKTNDYLALFECYNEWATASLNTLFSISGNATLARNNWNDENANIENDELKCLAVAFEDYQVRWNAEAQAWNQCVIGNGSPIATTPAPYPTTTIWYSTTTPPRTTTTTWYSGTTTPRTTTTIWYSVTTTPPPRSTTPALIVPQPPGLPPFEGTTSSAIPLPPTDTTPPTPPAIEETSLPTPFMTVFRPLINRQ